MESLSDPAAFPLRIWRQERVAQLRSLGLPSLEAVREAGYANMSAENARKLANKRHVLARVAYLRKQDAEVLAERRDIVAERQWLWHDFDIGDYYEDAEEPRFDKDGHLLIGPDGKPVMRHFQRLKPLSALTREQRLAIESLTYTENGKPNLKLHSKMQANIELRKIYGIDRPMKIAPTDPEGKAVPSTADRARALAAFIAETQAEMAADIPAGPPASS
jgi:hypothetical protein